MRVLVLLPRFAKGGAEKLACDIAIEIQKRPGITVKLASFDNENAYPKLTNQLDVAWVPSRVALSSIKKSTFQLEGYIRLLNEFKPDIIHSHLFETEIISRSANYPQAKYFTHCHDNMRQFETFHWNTLFSKKLLMEYYDRTYLLNRYRANGGNHFITISNNNYNYFKRVLPADLSKVTLLPNAINFSIYNSVNHTRSIDTVRMVNTGSFIPLKNQVFLVDVVHALRKKGVVAYLTFLGAGAEIGNVKNRALQLGVSDQITFAGNVDHVEEHLREANVYVHSAYSEAFGLVLVEAMAAGLPVVALDGKGNRDLVKDGQNGFFIKEQNVELFASKIIQLMTNKPLYESMTSQAVEFAKGFDIKNYVSRLLELYKNALAGN